MMRSTWARTRTKRLVGLSAALHQPFWQYQRSKERGRGDSERVVSSRKTIGRLALIHCSPLLPDAAWTARDAQRGAH